MDVLAVMDAIVMVERFSEDDVRAARAAVAELIDKANTAATVLSNLIAAGQVNAGYGGHVTDLTAALANVGGAK